MPIHKYIKRLVKKTALLKVCRWRSSEYDEYIFHEKWE